MRILILTKYAWDEKLASGNTLSNLFEGWEDTKFYCLYCRDALPNNNCCKEYYTISPINVSKNLFRPWRIGCRFHYDRSKNNSECHNKQEVYLTKLSKKNNRLFDFFYDCLYLTRLWKNKKFKQFLIEANPDLVFTFGTPDVLNHQTIKYVVRHFHVPVIAYFVDDHLNNNKSHWNLIQRMKKRRLIEIANMASKCYAISQFMCEEYSKFFNRQFSLLFKGCRSFKVKDELNSVIRFVYAGNLLYGRANILSEIAQAIDSNNRNCKFAELNIYTTTIINQDLKSKLEHVGSSTLLGAKPYSEIIKLMHDADVVLHVESFDEKQINSVRLSFSTKVTDCLQSGSMVLAIGPNQVASINYLSQVPGVVVIDKKEELFMAVTNLINNPIDILSNAKRTNSYSENFLSLEKVRRKLRNDFIQLLEITE